LKKIKQTTRKFYNKWDYKISFSFKGVSYLRILDPTEASKRARNPEVAEVGKELDSLDSSLYAKRLESSILDFYTNDKNIFDRLYNKFSNNVRHAFAPTESFESLVSHGHKILAKKLPHDRYMYKVFLQPHRINSAEEKAGYISWLEKQEPKIHITKTVKEWFYKTSWNWDRRYMYVEDESMLLMLKLKNSEALGTIYSFVISDK
jgi:hypothetical protein